MKRSASSPNFRRLLRGAVDGEIVVPALRAALFNPTFKAFEIAMPDMAPRKPDGWFHPSEHPMWPERMLYWYLVAPDRIVPEPLDPHSTMAIMQGHFWHQFIERVGLEVGVLTATEVAVKDEGTGSRGHMDGILSANEVFEFKTMRPSKFAKIEHGPPHAGVVLESWKRMVPEYYAQAQEYMRLSGYRVHRTLVLSLEYPFEMREIITPYDEVWAMTIAEKYRRVRSWVAEGGMPQPCCAPRSVDAKACPARLVCPVGVA